MQTPFFFKAITLMKKKKEESNRFEQTHQYNLQHTLEILAHLALQEFQKNTPLAYLHR